MSRTKIVAGNWKMNTSLEDGISLAENLAANHTSNHPLMIVIPPFTHLMPVKSVLIGSSIQIGAQNCHQEAKGAYTGEVSAPMLKSCGIPYVILGHSERRQYFNETDELLALKVDAALAQDLTPIFCVGESLEVRNENKQNDFVLNQLTKELFHLSSSEFSKIIIAYEPIWAIGTGVTASPLQAQEMHEFIRTQIEVKYDLAVAEACSILYGGSVKGANAREIFSQADVDGALVGGASLDAVDFLKIASGF